MSNPAVANAIQGIPLVTGGILRGTAGATLPTDASGTLTGFTGLGFVSEDGLTETFDRTTDKIKAWGGATIKVVQSEYSVNYQFTLYETLNDEVLKAVYGTDNVTTTADTSTAGTLHSVKINGATLEHTPWVFEMKDGTARIRVVIPDGQVNTVGDITYTDGGIIGYPVTLEAFPDSSGNNAYKYIDDGVFA